MKLKNIYLALCMTAILSMAGCGSADDGNVEIEETALTEIGTDTEAADVTAAEETSAETSVSVTSSYDNTEW